MSAAPFDPEALAGLAAPAPLAPSRVRLEPEGIRWAPQPSAAAGPAAPLLEAFFEAWCGTARALAFRHERLLNLAYVPTTTRPDALWRSAHAIALTPEPPLAASTWLAFSVRAVGGNPECDVPQGLAVQSIPVGAGRPQVYETDAALRARPEWNTLALRPPAPPALDPSTAATSGRVHAGGLVPGRRVGVTGEVDGRPFAAACVLTAVDRAPAPEAADAAAPRARRVSWAEPLAAGPALPIRGACAFELGASRPLFGADAADWASLPGAVRFELSAPRGGLVRLQPPRSGAPIAAQSYASFARLAGEPRAVAVRGDVWIAASDAGVFRSTDAGASWTSTGRTAWRVSATFWSDAGLWLGTESHGVLRSTDAGLTWEVQRGGTVVRQNSEGLAISLGRLPRCAVSALGAFAAGADGELVLAGTSSGPYYQLVGDPAWYPHSEGLPLRGLRTGMGGPAITAVALQASTGALWIGTDRGLFRAANLDAAWQPIALPSSGPVTVLIADDGGSMLVGFESGALYRLDATGATALGNPCSTERGGRVVRAACATSAGYWLGGDAGCFWSGDAQRWLCVSQWPVASLAALADGGVLAASQLAGCVDEDWPGFSLAADRLDLDRLQPAAIPGPAWVLDTARAERVVVHVRAVEERELSAFGIRRRVTRLVLEPEPRLLDFGRRTTQVYPSVRALGALHTAVEPRSASSPAPEALGGELLVDARLPDPTGRTVIVSGTPLRTRLLRGTVLVESASGRAVTLAADVLASLRGKPEQHEGDTVLAVLTEDGLEGTVRAAGLEILPGDPAAAPTSVVRRVEGFERRDTDARVTLDQPLDIPLDPSTTSVYANVVGASHGQRVEREVLGSGDPAQPAQRFKLTLPLCWLPTPRGAEPVLEVRVSEELWKRVDQRAALGAGERGYAVERDASGNSWICFGDGVFGARPPAGIENITACYRTGGGRAGNQPPGTIRLLRSRAPGLKSVTHCIAATGGSDVESIDALRARIPLHARLPDHIVSVPDLLDYLSVLDAIAKVSARQLWNGHAHVVHLTLATTDRANAWALDPSSRLATSILTLSKRAAVQIDSVVVSWFAATLEIAIEADLEPAPVIDAVRAALQAAFGFEARELGAAVSPAALVGVAMRTRGVINAALRRLCPVGDSSVTDVTDVTPLPGVLARYDADAGVVRPARLWLIGPDAPPSDEQASRGLVVRSMEAP